MRGLKITYVFLVMVLFQNNAITRNRHVKDIDGVVISHSYRATGTYLGSPSICILPNGDYLVCHDEFGKGKKNFDGNPIYLSKNKGRTWKLLSVVKEGVRWPKIFVANRNVYLIGPSNKGGGIRLFCSDDSGRTWSEPICCFSDRMFHTAPVPVVQFGGRIWKGFEVIDSSLPKKWPKQYCAAMFSAPVDSDYMNPESWTLSEYIKPDFSCLESEMRGWLEGNAVPGKDGNMRLVMRVDLPEGFSDEYIAELEVSADGKELSFDSDRSFYHMPGGAKKFTIRYDGQTDTYITLSNETDALPDNKRPGDARNILSLCISEDLHSWTVVKRVILSDDMDYTGFQYVDWQIEGKDIIFVVRTSYYDDKGGAHNHHDSNYITFHKLKNYRSYIK